MWLWRCGFECAWSLVKPSCTEKAEASRGKGRGSFHDTTLTRTINGSAGLEWISLKSILPRFKLFAFLYVTLWHRVDFGSSSLLGLRPHRAGQHLSWISKINLIYKFCTILESMQSSARKPPSQGSARKPPRQGSTRKLVISNLRGASSE